MCSKKKSKINFKIDFGLLSFGLISRKKLAFALFKKTIQHFALFPKLIREMPLF